MLVNRVANNVQYCRFNDSCIDQLSGLVGGKGESDHQDEAGEDSTAESIHTGLSSDIYRGHSTAEGV